MRRLTPLQIAFACSTVALLCAACSAELRGDASDGTTSEELRGAYAVGTPLRTTTDLNHRRGPSTSDDVLQVIPSGTVVRSASAQPRGEWYGVTWNGKTGWVFGRYLSTLGSTDAGSPTAASVSARGQDQMRRVVAYAEAHNSGRSGGTCYRYVWDYLWRSGYGDIDSYYDAPDMGSAEARMFAEYMNQGGNAARWGLQRLPISSPYDAPVGAVVVVAAGSPGTSHPTAGDISIAAGGGRFINDGPNMSYGGRAAFAASGRLLGAYVPR